MNPRNYLELWELEKALEAMIFEVGQTLDFGQSGLGYNSRLHSEVPVFTSSSPQLSASFDRFQIDLSSGDLRTAEGTVVRIQQQPLQILRLLLEADGESCHSRTTAYDPVARRHLRGFRARGQYSR